VTLADLFSEMTPKSNISATSNTINNDSHNTSTESKRSLLRVGSSFLHRIQSSTSFMGPKHFNVSVQLLDDLESVQGSFKVIRVFFGVTNAMFVLENCNRPGCVRFCLQGVEHR
jgi:hypothetical protein